MTTVTFDTDAAIQTLVDRGIKFEEARALVRVVVDSQRDLVTKADLTLAFTQLENKLTQLENKLTIRIGVMLVAVVGLVGGINKWL